MVNKRPPFLGYNHNVRHKGHLFHVQTEDSGLSRPVLTTHVFIEGTILATMRAQYTVDEPDPIVQKRMQDQHKTMLKRVRDGEFDRGALAAGKSTEAVPESAAVDSANTTARLVVQPAAAAAVPPPVEGTQARKPGQPAPPLPPRKEAASPAAAAPPLAERQTAEILRPIASPRLERRTGEGAQEPAPPSGSKTSDRHQALAARLGIAPAVPQGIVPPPPIGPGKLSAATGAATVELVTSAPAPVDEDDIEPVVELEVPPPGDDDEPSVTILAAEPTDEESDAADLSKATPLPVAVPLGQDDTFMMGAASVAPPPRPSPFHVSVPLGHAPRPGRSTRPLASRPLRSGALRARPTSEGVVVLCLGALRNKVVSQAPHAAESLRATKPHLHPTTPSPLSKMGLLVPADDAQLFDEKLMAFLRREATR